MQVADRYGAPSRTSSQLFGSQATQIRCERRRHFVFRYRSAAHWLEVFRTTTARSHKAFAAPGDSAKAALERDITALLERAEPGGEHSLVIPSEYLEIVVTKA